MNDSKLQIIINAKDEASKVFDNLRKDNKKTITSIKKISAAGAAAVGAIGAVSIKMAADFEKSMSNVATLVDTNVESMDEMEKAVLDISKRTPVALGDLTDALYDVRSAGISAEGAMAVLENSAKLATTGLGTTKEATDVLTSAINAFGLDSKKSDKWADVFFKTVKSGKTTVAELAQGFGQVAPLASELGLKFEDLMATTAAMTTSGMKASVAYTQQRAILSNLLKPTKEMREAMESVGITSESLSEIVSEKGLTGTIRMLSESVGGNKAELAKMFGSVEGLNAVMMLLGDTGKNSIDIFNQMMSGTNAMDEAMRKQNETASAQYQILKNNLNVELIKLGNIILPALIETIKPIIENTTKWMEENKELTKKIIIGIAAFGGLILILGSLLIILPGIISAVGLLTGALGLILSPIGLVVVAIGLAITIGKKLIDNWDVFKASLVFIWDTIKTKASEIFEGIKKIIIDTADKVIEAWSNLPENLGYLLGLIGRYIWEKWDEIRNFFREILPEIINGIVEWFSGLPSKISEKLQSLLETVRNKIGEIPGIVMEAIKGVKDKITQPFRDAADWVRNFKLPSIKMPDVMGGLSNLGSRIQSGFSTGFNDFISRPGSAPVAFSPDDTIIGVKNPAALGGGKTVNVYIQGGNYLDREAGGKFAELLGRQLNLELRH